MIALLIAGFLIYLYAPHLVFKFAAEGKYDFVTRKEVPQVEEFFAAGLPSLFLNGIAWLVLRALPRLHLRRSGIDIDRHVIGAVFTKDPDLRPYFDHGDLRPLIIYLLTLYVVSWLAGRAYGTSLRSIALAGGTEQYLNGGNLGLRLSAVIYRRVWREFYQQYEQPLYPQILQNSYAFVHTNHGLYHGILYAADKQPDGELDGITLVSVHRFSRKTERECFENGENPIRVMTGPLFIRWSDIIDINYPPSGKVLESKRAYYEDKLKEHAQRRAKEKRGRNAVAKLRRLLRHR